jgi:hypothetical protein
MTIESPNITLYIFYSSKKLNNKRITVILIYTVYMNINICQVLENRLY